MTTQEPEHESGPVVSRPALLTRAAWGGGKKEDCCFFFGRVVEGVCVVGGGCGELDSPLWKTSHTEDLIVNSPDLWPSSPLHIDKEFNFTKVTQKDRKKFQEEDEKRSVKRQIRLMYPWAL